MLYRHYDWMGFSRGGGDLLVIHFSPSATIYERTTVDCPGDDLGHILQVT